MGDGAGRARSAREEMWRPLATQEYASNLISVRYLRVFPVEWGQARPATLTELTIALYSKSVDAFDEIPFCFERQRPHSLLINGT